MKLRQLQDFFPPDRHKDIEGLFARFSAEHGEDVEAFVVELHKRSLIDTDTLRDILTQHEISLSPPPDPDVPSTRLTERHQVVALLGKGAMGEVFIGRDLDLKRTVAIKRIDPKYIKKPAFSTRFFAEAQITAQLDHPSIVPIYGVERDAEGCLSYAMKFVRGQTLKEFMDESRTFYEKGKRPDEQHGLKARIEKLLPVMNAIDYAHRRGVIHRDLKPDNIMVGGFGEVLVMDWGIARPIGKRERVTASASVEKTRAGSIVGTPSYMSPEQASGATEELDGTSDQYSLGLILFELVTLRRAITAETSFETVVKAASGARTPLVHLSSKEKIPRELRGIIEKATAKNPDDRYATVGDFADDLRRFLRDEAVLAQPDNLLQRVKRWVGHHRGLALGLGFSLMMSIFVVAAVLQWRSATALEKQRADARQREQRLAEVGSLVTRQAHAMNGRLFAYTTLLSGLTHAAELALTTTPDDGPIILPEDLKTAPVDLRESSVYDGSSVSATHADLVLLAGQTRDSSKTELLQLASLSPTMKRIALRSHSEDAESLAAEAQRKLLLDEGVPLVWVYLGTENGQVTGFPGVWSYEAPDGAPYDPRNMAWYKMGKDSKAAIWDSSGVDEGGLGLLMTAAQAIRDPRTHKLLGVAAIDLTFPYFIDALLDNEKLVKVSESFLIDTKSQLMVRGSQKAEARKAKEYAPPRFDSDKALGADGKAILEAAGRSPFGHLELPGGRLALWSRVEATGWIYVVIGDTNALLSVTNE